MKTAATMATWVQCRPMKLAMPPKTSEVRSRARAAQLFWKERNLPRHARQEQLTIVNNHHARCLIPKWTAVSCSTEHRPHIRSLPKESTAAQWTSSRPISTAPHQSQTPPYRADCMNSTSILATPTNICQTYHRQQAHALHIRPRQPPRQRSKPRPRLRRRGNPHCNRPRCRTGSHKPASLHMPDQVRLGRRPPRPAGANDPTTPREAHPGSEGEDQVGALCRQEGHQGQEARWKARVR